MPNLEGMDGFKKRLLAGAVASALLAVSGALAQSADEAIAPEDQLAALYDQLAEPGREDVAQIEAEIIRLWSRSGSPAMDLLLRRGSEALEAEDYAGAVEHLSALTDHAPEFAEGWNARATAFYLLDEYSLAVSDIERTLALNPNHFGALEGLASIFEETGRPDLALRAVRAATEINPNRVSLTERLERLEREAGAAEL